MRLWWLKLEKKAELSLRQTLRIHTAGTSLLCPDGWGDENSEGCNQLIRRNQAALVQSAEDVCYLMGWDADSEKKETKQVELFVALNKVEEALLGVLASQEKLSIDRIATQTKQSIPKILEALLQLEMKGLVRALPGNFYAKA